MYPFKKLRGTLQARCFAIRDLLHNVLEQSVGIKHRDSFALARATCINFVIHTALHKPESAKRNHWHKLIKHPYESQEPCFLVCMINKH